MDRDELSPGHNNHRGTPGTGASRTLRQTATEHDCDSSHGEAVGNREARRESPSRTRERRVIRRATLICLAVTLLPLIVVAALLAKSQIDNSEVVSQAQANERAALSTLNECKLAEAQAQADVVFAQNNLKTAESKSPTGQGPLVNLYEEQLQIQEQRLYEAQVRTQIATEHYDAAQISTARAESQLGNPLNHWIIYAGVVGAVVVGDTLFILYLHTDRERDLENRAIVQSIAESTARLEAGSTDVADLWLANEKQLAGYHQLVLNYAATSRATTKFSLWFGFVFVAVVSLCVLFTHSIATTIASSVIATVGAAVTAYIARTVLRNSETSSTEVIEFFSHPIETQRLLTARQLIEGMPEEAQAQAKLVLIKELVRARGTDRSSQKSPSRRSK